MEKKEMEKKEIVKDDILKNNFSIKNILKLKICELLSEISGKNINDSMIKATPSFELGDFAFPCFVLDKDARKAAEDVKTKIDLLILQKKLDFLDNVTVVGPYLNFYVNRSSYTSKVISLLIEKSSNEQILKNNQKIIIEYSQANTHKAFHVGHLFGTSMGESLARILKYYGYEVIQVNYEGDTGIHVAKWIWCYNKFHSNENPSELDRESWIASIYVDAVRRLAEGKPEEDKEGLEEVRIINKHIENRDDENILNFWKKTRQWSLDAFETIYSDLKAHFDDYFFESDMEEPAKKIVSDLLERNIAKIDDGASIIDLNDKGLGIWVLLRNDGTTLYSAKDLALAKIKNEKYKPDKSIYIVGAAQSLHFKQLFETLKIMDFSNSDNLYHLPLTEIRLPTGKMSSRTGQNILFSDMKKDVWDYSFLETKKRHEDWSDEKIRLVSKAIMISAIKFGMIGKDPNKSIVFDLQKSCEFEGETGPYIQYVCARISSILKRIGEKINYDIINKGKLGVNFSKDDFSDVNLSEIEYSLVTLLDNFFDIIAESSEKYKVFLLAKYLSSVAKQYNEFYHSCRIYDEKNERIKKFRIELSKSTYFVLTKGLYLLGIDILDEM